ncbi:F-box domain [Arabidopsis thaliana x Arabidopsis arenosa]|nr:F-box domain [Arabidopsis thaliana x Arabidopsis arenosa]OAP17454.1 hypothetical protein AXX17_AT1G48260 [Arabidopsis thaliana]CAA0292912.1 unnamed protein product [Arabidopsis thaliana]
MTKQKQYVSDVNLTVCGSNKPSSTPGKDIEYFGLIPVDLFISNILSRLPLKSKAKCRCVSKLWSSIIRRPNYNQLFPIKSPAPRILFTIEYAGILFFYSSPQPHNPDENSSLVATLHQNTGNTKFYEICGPVCGRVLCRQYNSVGVIYNPITGESSNLPKLSLKGINKSEWLCDKARYSFGYDPIEKQLKVLCITWLRTGSEHLSNEYQVLTLGTENKKTLLEKDSRLCNSFFLGQYCDMHRWCFVLSSNDL